MNRLASALLACLVLFPACAEDEPLTQIVVVVDSDIPNLSRIVIDVNGFTEPLSIPVELESKRLPRRLTLVHDGGALGPIEVVVSAFRDGASDAVLVERRSDIEFVPDATRMLRIDLLLECVGQCSGDMPSCLAGPRCAPADRAWTLEPWSGDVEPLGTADAGTAPPDSDAGPPSVSDGGPTTTDATVMPTPDAGGDATVPGDGGTLDSPFPYTPSNFDPTLGVLASPGRAVTLNCDRESVFDSSSGEYTDWCGPEPVVVQLEQGAGLPLAVLLMDSLAVESGDTLRVVGDRPVALVVLGDARIDGTIDASARASMPGPGADFLCESGPLQLSGPGGDSGADVGAGGGGGGGFGGPGGRGGRGADGSVAVAGGRRAGNSALIPLRGGCSGGAGGSFDGVSAIAGGGGGGGALQISATGLLDVTGVIAAVGGGGGASGEVSDGGGGGGSGGAILLEGAPLDVDSGALLLAGGGAGGGGQSGQSADSTPGDDGSRNSVAPAVGGTDTGGGVSSAGDGGEGGALGQDPAPGGDGRTLLIGVPGGGGGGGGGGGRIRLNGAERCALGTGLSPAPSVSCPACLGACADPPAQGCVLGTYAASHYYYVCDGALPWDDALASCAAVGMDLAVPDDMAENDFLQSLIASPAWIGGHDRVLEGSWVWVNGVVFWSGDATGAAVDGAYTHWRAEQPSATANDADCLELELDGNWHADACDMAHTYVCEQ